MRMAKSEGKIASETTEPMNSGQQMRDKLNVNDDLKQVINIESIFIAKAWLLSPLCILGDRDARH